MNVMINILTKKGITNLDIFISYSLFCHKFQKTTKLVLMVVADYATDNFLLSLNGASCFPQISFDLSVFLFQEDSKCIENQKQICCP